MADVWDQFQDAPSDSGADPWAQFADAPEDVAQPKESLPEPVRSPAHPGALDQFAATETLASFGTGAVATPLAGIAGIGTAAANAMGLTDAEPADVVRNVQGALTYQPRTQGGQRLTEMVGYIPEKIGQFADWAGGKTTDATGSPLAGTAVNTFINAAPAGLLKVKPKAGVVPRNGNGGTSPVARPAAPASQAKPNTQPAAPANGKAGLGGVSKAAPSIDELRTLKNDAYKRADESGIVVNENSLKGLKTRIVGITKKEGLNSKLHPDSAAALQEILKSKGNLTLTEVETLRKIANDAKGSIKPPDSRIGAKMVEELDSYLDNLTDTDVVTGTPAKAKVLSEARALNTRLKRSETIARLMDRAETKAGAHYTQAGMEHAIRGEFKQLALNDKELRRFSPAEQAAIKKIARGGKWENSLRNLGKFDPSSGGMAAFMSALLAGGGAVSTGGASLLLPAAEFAAKRRATTLTSRKVKDLDEMVRSGSSQIAQPKRRNALATTP
jgi:hypothetical protein